MISTVLLVIIGFVANSVSTEPKCDLIVNTISATLTLTPSSEYCDQTTITISGIVRGECSNNGDNCVNYHFRDGGSADPEEEFCVPTATTEIISSVSIPVQNCDKTVTYSFVNITECGCNVIHYPSYPSYHI